MKPIWIWRSHSAPPQQIGAKTITPIIRTIGVHWSSGGWLWQFPLAVDIKDERKGTQQRLPIPDPTRTTLWFMLAVALIVLFVSALARRQRRQPESQKLSSADS